MDSRTIRSRSNPLVRRLRELRDRGDASVMVLEGWRLVAEALSAGIAVEHVVVGPESIPAGSLAERLRLAKAHIDMLSEDLLRSVSSLESPPGVIAIARRPTFFRSALYKGTPLIVVAAGIQNPGNLGGLLRTAEAAGGSGAYLTAGTADPFSSKSLRGSMGSAFRLPSVSGDALASAISEIQSHKVRVIAADSGGSVDYDKADWTLPSALLFGSEGAGLPETALAKADERVRIPLVDCVESLNVGVAAGILLFEAARQRRAGKGP